MIILQSEWKHVTWRNGLGTSDEILSRPDIMLNCTQIPGDVAFSSYPDFERILVLVAGDLILKKETGNIVLQKQGIHRFAGEENVEALVRQGPAVVFNVLVSTQHWRVCENALLARGDVLAGGMLTVLYVAQGHVRLRTGTTLTSSDTLITKYPIEVSSQSGWSITCQIEAISDMAIASKF